MREGIMEHTGQDLSLCPAGRKPIWIASLPDPPRRDPDLVLWLPGYKIPSLNTLLAMNQWARKKARDKAQDELLSALKAAVSGLSTQEQTSTEAARRLRTALSTLESYVTTRKATRKATSSKKKSAARKKKGR